MPPLPQPSRRARFKSGSGGLRANALTRLTGYWLTLDEPLLVTLPVVTETCHLLLKWVGNEKALAFLRGHQRGVFQVFDLGEAYFPRILELMVQYASLPMDFADASLVILAEALDHGRILSTNQRDFHAYRWKNRHPFENLLIENP